MTKKTTTSTATKKATTSTSKKLTTACATKTTSTSATKTSASANPYKNNGITISPTKFSAGDKIKITYNGMLSQNGATEVFAHIGWGNSWNNISDIKMSKTKSGFTATVVASDSLLNVCFKDICENWDNNNGNDYTIC